MAVVAKSFGPHFKKTIELIIYIASRLKDKPNYGSTLLGKSLYLIDSLSYLKTGKPITLLTYIKQDHGPTPDPGKFLPLREVLIKEGDLVQSNSEYFGRTQHKLFAKREPNINVFQKDEIVLINDVIESVGDQNATEISDYTHQFLAWIFANKKEELPFYTFLLTATEPDSKDYQWAKTVIGGYRKTVKHAS